MLQKTKSSPQETPIGVYLLTGEDEFRKKLFLDKLKNKLFGDETDAFSYETFYARESSAEEIIRSLETLPMLAKRKLVVLKETESLSKEDKNRLLSYLKRGYNPRSILVLSAKSEASRDDKFISSLSVHAKVVDFKNLSPDDITAWIEKEFGARGKKISRRAASLICDASGYDMGQASSIIEQISTFAYGKDRITDEDVVRFTGESFSEGSAFQFLDYINDKDINHSLRILKSLLRSESNPSKIIGLLGWHITRLISAKRLLLRNVSRSEMLSYFNAGSHTLNRLISQAENFTLRQLNGQLKALLDTDIKIKRSGLNPEFLLEMLVVKLGRS